MKQPDSSFSLADFPTLFATPSLTIAEADKNSAGETLPISDEILELEAYVKAHPNPFPWAAHNELRHLYSAISEVKSMEHSDIILANSFMDDYILDVLSNWQLEKDSSRALIILLNKAEKYSHLLHLRAACLVQAGDVCQEYEKTHEAAKLYEAALMNSRSILQKVPSLKPYHQLACFKLSLDN